MAFKILDILNILVQMSSTPKNMKLCQIMAVMEVKQVTLILKMSLLSLQTSIFCHAASCCITRGYMQYHVAWQELLKYICYHSKARLENACVVHRPVFKQHNERH